MRNEVMEKITPALAKDVRRAITNRKYELSEDGVYFPGSKVTGNGVFIEYLNGQEVGVNKNRLVDQGLVHLLNVVLGAESKQAAWYVPLFSGNVSVAANWTAATFASQASEIISTTEGYAGANRPTWTGATATTPTMNNNAAPALYTIASAGTLTVRGAALISSQARGATTGVLWAASRFANDRQLQNGDEYGIKYATTFTSA
jgi:hypothetical protein